MTQTVRQTGTQARQDVATPPRSREVLAHELALVTARLRVRTTLEDAVREHAAARGVTIATYSAPTQALMRRQQQLRTALDRCSDTGEVAA